MATTITSEEQENLTAYYGLPKKVIFCKRCVYSNQVPSSYPEFKHKAERICPTLPFNDEGVCDACRYNDIKKNIDWEKRENELHKLLDRHRKNDGSYDCIVPGSGGKDSVYAAHLLKYKYGMHPLTVTWPPTAYTEYGSRNFKNWLEKGGFDNVTFKPSGRVHQLLTRLGVLNLLHPFQTFILGQKNLAPKIAALYGIPLVFYGENEAEYNNPIADNTSSLRSRSFYTLDNLKDTYIGGVLVPELQEKYKLSLNDLMAYLPARPEDLDRVNIEVHYMGYYVKWTPQEAYYYAVEHSGFEARPFRTEGTYSKYNSIDDKIDDLHYYTTHVKFGIGRATYDAAQEIRNKHITREEGVTLVHRFDGEFPQRYFQELMDYLEIKPEEFVELCDRFRSPHLWKKENGKWVLRHRVS